MAILAEAIPLHEPVWQRQDAENEQEWRAFDRYLVSRSLTRVIQELGLPDHAVRLTAVRWSWHVRTIAWDRAVTADALSGAKVAALAMLVDSVASRTAAARAAQEIVQIELDKKLQRVKATPAEVIDKSIDLMRYAQIATLQRQDILEACDDPELAAKAPADYSRLTGDELTELRRLKAKALG